jgi:hypothetical protein
LEVKGLKLAEIAPELSNTYGRDAYASPSIKYWLHQIKLNDIDFKIISVLGKFQFSSVRTIVTSLNIPLSTIYTHLVWKRLVLKYFTSLGSPRTNQ